MLMMKDVTDDSITQTSTILMNMKVHLAITDIGLLLYSMRPELTIPYHMMTKKQIYSVRSLAKCMSCTNSYVVGSKMTHAFFAAPTTQALYIAPPHRVLHACITLLQTQKLSRPVFEFMMHRILRTCNWPGQVINQTCLLMESNCSSSSSAVLSCKSP